MIGVIFYVTKCYQLQMPYFLQLRNTGCIKFVSWTSQVIQESISYCLAGLRYSLFAYLAFICLYLSFDRLKFPLLKKCFSDLNLYEAVRSSDLVVQLKLKCLQMKPTHDDIIEAKEVYSQLSFEIYQGKLMLCN